MKKVIHGNRIDFIDELSQKLLMYIAFFADECIWYFNDSNEIIITDDVELFEQIKHLMKQQYIFNDEVLKSYKKENKLIWYSDCYYNPDDEESKNNVSYLTIICEDNVIKLKCTKPLYEKLDIKNKSHIIGFSPMGNGKYTKNVKTNMTLQDDFIINVYQKLLK